MSNFTIPSQFNCPQKISTAVTVKGSMVNREGLGFTCSVVILYMYDNYQGYQTFRKVFVVKNEETDVCQVSQFTQIPDV